MLQSKLVIAFISKVKKIIYRKKKTVAISSQDKQLTNHYEVTNCNPLKGDKEIRKSVVTPS